MEDSVWSPASDPPEAKAGMMRHGWDAASLSSGIWRKHSVSPQEWSRENQRHGSVYFIKDHEQDMVKIGHSRTPFDRMKVLQIGSAGRLRMIGVMAAPRALEGILHQSFNEGHIHGEWFFDRDMISLFLHDVTGGEPLCRTAWELVPGRPVWANWDEKTKSHKVCHFDPGTASWEMASP